jgi:hypothetical protein
LRGLHLNLKKLCIFADETDVFFGISINETKIYTEANARSNNTALTAFA